MFAPAPRSANLAGVAALALWATLAALSRLAQPMPPLAMAAAGFTIAGAVGMAALALTGRLGLLRQPPLGWAHGVGGLAGYHALYFVGLALAPPVEANLVNYAWPLLTVLLAAPLRGLRLGGRRLAGVALGAVGVAFLLGDAADAGGGAARGIGLFCALLAAAVWAGYSLLADRFAQVPSEAVFAHCLAAAPLLWLAHLALEPPIAAAPGWAALLLLGLGPMGLAFPLWDRGMKRGDPRLLGTLAYAVPVLSTLALLALGEGALTWRVAAAALLVAGGGLLAATARP